MPFIWGRMLELDTCPVDKSLMHVCDGMLCSSNPLDGGATHEFPWVSLPAPVITRMQSSKTWVSFSRHYHHYRHHHHY